MAAVVDQTLPQTELVQTPQQIKDIKVAMVSLCQQTPMLTVLVVEEAAQVKLDQMALTPTLVAVVVVASHPTSQAPALLDAVVVVAAAVLALVVLVVPVVVVLARAQEELQVEMVHKTRDRGEEAAPPAYLEQAATAAPG